MANKKLTIMTILGTRPEIIRLSRILPKMDQAFNHIVVYTQQSYDYEMSDIFFEQLHLRNPDHRLQVRSETLGGQIANIIKQTEEVILKEKPDAVFVLGDTNSALSAINARRLKIPVFHMEAGNRSFDYQVPEETNRTIVDHISDYNLCYTEHSRRYLLREGINPQRIFVVGSPLTEIFLYYKKEIESSKILSELKLSPKKYFLVSAHREENVDNVERLKELFESFASLSEAYKAPVIVSLHPRTKKRLEEKKIKVHSNVILLKPFGYFDYSKLQKSALCVLSDSGTIQEESAILGFDAIQIRVSTERPEAFDAGTITLTGYHKDAIINAIEFTVNNNEKSDEKELPQDYKSINVSSKVVKLILGLTSINKYHDKRI